MTWFMKQRQDFIRAQLEVFGQIRRADIVKRFEVTIAIASSDIATFIEQHPDAIDYDRSTKCYALNLAALPAAETDPDLGKIEPGHVCKHGVRWPHACAPCDDTSFALHQGEAA